MQTNAEQLRQRIQQSTIYYNPYSRLQFRNRVEQWLELHKQKESIPSNIDFAALFDAVAKRGGSQNSQLRIQQISLSLPFYDTTRFYQLYIKYVAPLQSKLLKDFPKILIKNDPFIQQHCLPLTEGRYYYELPSDEYAFMKDYYSCTDEYFCLKTLAYGGADLQKLNAKYYEKYYRLRKWLFCKGEIMIQDKEQLGIMGLPIPDSPVKICIIGFNLANILLGSKLAASGLSVKIIESDSEKIQKYAKGHIPDIIKQGVFLLNSAQANSFSKTLKTMFNLSVNSLEIVPSELSCMSHDRYQQYLNSTAQNPNNAHKNIGNRSYLQKISFSQTVFLSILEQLLIQQNNNTKKTLWQQIGQKVNIRNKANRAKIHINPPATIEIDLIKWHLDRFLMFNKIKDEFQATVGDLRKFTSHYYSATPSHHKLKIGLKNSPCFITPSTPSSREDTQKLLCLSQKFVKVKFSEGKWILTSQKLSNGELMKQQFTHVIYGQDRSISKCISDNEANYKINCIDGQIFNHGFPILQQLSLHSQIHCLYRFQEKVWMKTDTDPNQEGPLSNYASYCSEYGTIHFIILPNRQEVYAMATKAERLSVDYYKEIFAILSNKILKKSYKIATNQNLIQQLNWFYLKDQRFLDNLVKVRNQEKLYFNLPVISAQSSRCALQSQLYLANKIYETIVKGLNSDDMMKQKVLALKIQDKKLEQLNIPKQAMVSQAMVKTIKNMPQQGKQKQTKTNEKSSKKQVCQNNLQKPGLKQQNEVRKEKIASSRQLSRNQERDHISERFPSQERSREKKKKYEPERKKDFENMSNSRERLDDRVNLSLSLNRRDTSIDDDGLRDYFGFMHPIVKKYRYLLTQEIKNLAHNTDYFEVTTQQFPIGICRFTPLRIDHPIQLQKGLWLNSMGFPKFNSIYSNNSTKSMFASCCIQANFSSRREYLSWIDPQQNTVYFQTIVTVKGKQYFCIIDQNIYELSKNPQVSKEEQNILELGFFYHTSELALFNKFHQAIFGRKQKLKTKPVVPKFVKKKQNNRYGRYGLPEYLLGSVISKIIMDQIDSPQTKEYSSADKILQAKFNCTFPIKVSKKMDALYQQNPPKFIEEQLCDYLQGILTLSRLKQYSLWEIFIGKINPIFICKEIQGIFTKSYQSIEQIMENDPQLGQQMKIIMNVGKGFSKFKYDITKDAMRVQLRRYFMMSVDSDEGIDSNNMAFYRQVIHPKPVQDQSDDEQFVFSGYPENSQLYKDKIQKVIKNCLKIYKSHEIIGFFKELINEEIQMAGQLVSQSKKIGAYFKMTRLRNRPPSEEQVSGFKHLLENSTQQESQTLTPEEMENAIKTYKNGNIRVIKDDYICLLKL